MKYIKTYEYMSEFSDAESGQTDFVFSIYPGVAYIRKSNYPEEVIRAARYNPPHFTWEVETDYFYDLEHSQTDFTTLRDLVESGTTAPYFLITSTEQNEIVDHDNWDNPVPHVIVDSSWNCQIEDQSDPYGGYTLLIRHYTNPRYNIRLDVLYYVTSGEEYVKAYANLLTSNEGE